MSESDKRLRISDLYNAIDRAIHHFKTQWGNDGLKINGDYFIALDSAISDIEVDSGLFDYRIILKEAYEKETLKRLKKMRDYQNETLDPQDWKTIKDNITASKENERLSK